MKSRKDYPVWFYFDDEEDDGEEDFDDDEDDFFYDEDDEYESDDDDFEIDDDSDSWILGQLELCEGVFIQIDTNIGIITGLFVEGFTVIHMFVDTFLNSEYAEQIDTYIDFIKKWCAKMTHTDT